jgi:hypothetical protein
LHLFGIAIKKARRVAGLVPMESALIGARRYIT